MWHTGTSVMVKLLIADACSLSISVEENIFYIPVAFETYFITVIMHNHSVLMDHKNGYY